MSEEEIKSTSAPSNFLDTLLIYFGTNTRVKFSGNCLEQDKLHILMVK